MKRVGNRESSEKLGKGYPDPGILRSFVFFSLHFLSPVDAHLSGMSNLKRRDLTLLAVYLTPIRKYQTRVGVFCPSADKAASRARGSIILLV